jgi:PAS domain S-box-containing protein
MACRLVVSTTMSRLFHTRGWIARSWSVRSLFWFFGLILALPLAVLASFLIIEIGQSVRLDTEQRMKQVAAGIAADLDRDLQRRITILQTLATSATLAQGNLSAFHARAQLTAKDLKAGIFLVDLSLRQILNTNVPFGSALPDYGAPDTARRTFQTKSPQVSNFFIGRVINRPVFDVDIPVMKGDDVAYVLAMGMEPPLLDEILRGQQLPSEWILNVADRNGVIIARSSESGKYVGTTLRRELLAQQSNIVARSVSTEGAQVLRSVAYSRIANWQVAVNVPLELAEAPLKKSYLLLSLWAAGALLLTALLASWFSRKIARPIGIAASAATGLIHRQPIAPLDSHVTEANELIAALRRASDELSEAENQRKQAEEHQRAAYLKVEEEKSRAEALSKQREILFEANPSGLLVVDHEGRIRLLNGRLTQKFGYTREELTGRLIETLVPARFRDHHAALREAFAAAPSPRPMGAGRDLYGLSKDGSEFPIEIGLTPLAVDGREMTLATVIDITERKNTEQAMAESARRQATLYQFVDRLHRAESLAAVYDAALDAIAQALRCDRASILLRDDAGVMRFVSWRGLSDRYRQAVDGHSPWPGEELNPQPKFVPDIASADMDDSLRAIVRSEGIESLAFIPLVANGKLIGKFMTYYDAPHVFDDDELDLSLIIARQLALSIDRKRADETEKILVAELQHRTKNLFAVIQALALRSLRGNNVLDDARRAFIGRLTVLARSYERLTNKSWKGASLKDLVRLELEQFGSQAAIDGNDVILSPQAAQNFALALHELATNAAKYGALSNSDGDVAIGWTVVGTNGRGVLQFSWREKGGPPLVKPQRDGFGTSLLKLTLGEARIEYAPDGLIFEVDLPLDQIGAAGG